jgi:hypothetical protein
MIKINWTLFRSAKYLKGVNSLGDRQDLRTKWN